MKNCPYCAEEIQDAAIKCKHCGELLEKDGKPETAAPKMTLVRSEVKMSPPTGPPQPVAGQVDLPAMPPAISPAPVISPKDLATMCQGGLIAGLVGIIFAVWFSSLSRQLGSIIFVVSAISLAVSALGLVSPDSLRGLFAGALAGTASVSKDLIEASSQASENRASEGNNPKNPQKVREFMREFMVAAVFFGVLTLVAIHLSLSSNPPVGTPPGSTSIATGGGELKNASGRIYKGTKLYTLTGVYFGVVVDVSTQDSEGQECVIVDTVIDGEGNPRFFLRRKAIRDGMWRVKE